MGLFSFVKAGKKIYGTIKSVKPALGKSKLNSDNFLFIKF